MGRGLGCSSRYVSFVHDVIIAISNKYMARITKFGAFELEQFIAWCRDEGGVDKGG